MDAGCVHPWLRPQCAVHLGQDPFMAQCLCVGVILDVLLQAVAENSKALTTLEHARRTPLHGVLVARRADDKAIRV